MCVCIWLGVCVYMCLNVCVCARLCVYVLGCVCMCVCEFGGWVCVSLFVSESVCVSVCMGGWVRFSHQTAEVEEPVTTNIHPVIP